MSSPEMCPIGQVLVISSLFYRESTPKGRIKEGCILAPS